MKVFPSSSKAELFFSPIHRDFPLEQNYNSTIRFGKSSKEENVFTWVWGKICGFFAWIKSWFVTADDEQEESRFFKVETDGKTIRYRIEDTENEVRMSSRVVHLNNISIPDEDEKENLPEMLSHIMKEEKIDTVMTVNLYYAWLMWKAGLKTEGDLPFSPQGKTHLDKFVIEVLQLAGEKRANGLFNENLLKDIERELVRAIINDCFNTGGGQVRDLHQSMSENSQEALRNHFEGRKAIKQLLALEKALGFQINFNDLVQEAPENSVERLALEHLSRNAPHARYTAYDLGSFSIPIKSLFILLKGMKMGIKRSIPSLIPPISFSRG